MVRRKSISKETEAEVVKRLKDCLLGEIVEKLNICPWSVRRIKREAIEKRCKELMSRGMDYLNAYKQAYFDICNEWPEIKTIEYPTQKENRRKTFYENY